MKRKLTVPKRNPFVCLVLKKTGAGSHRKPHKALRKLNKQSRYDENGYHIRLLPELSGIVPQCLDHVTILKYITMLFRGSDHKESSTLKY